MKHVLFSLLVLFSLNAKAADMSRTEDRDAVYSVEADGEEYYRGGCSTHQDYENITFTVTQTVVEYFEPKYLSELGFNQKMKGVEKALIKTAAAEAGVSLLTEADDITVERITSTKFLGLDLWRLNIGVGGGNGMYLVYNRVVQNNKPVYELMSNVFDGDLVFCDSKVWIKK